MTTPEGEAQWEKGRRTSSFLAERRHIPEMMDGSSISTLQLERALHELAFANRWLGGHHASATGLRPYLRRSARRLRILDIGAGIGDGTVAMVRLARALSAEVEVVAADLRPDTVALAEHYVRRHLGTDDTPVSVVTADARTLPFADRSFDIVHAALFLHHFSNEEAPAVVAEMKRVARLAVVVNDLHRHPITYAFVRMMAAVPMFGEVFSHDGPVSVRCSFLRSELEDIFARAGLDADVRWHPGFRWIATASIDR